MRVLIAGCGYVGCALGARLVRAGHEVFGLRRSRESSDELHPMGIRPLFGDIINQADLEALPKSWDWVVNCAGSSSSTPDDYRATYVSGNRNLLQWLEPSPPRKFVYTSSTRVYAQDDGSWISEDAATEPASETGKLLVEAEQLLLDSAKARAFPAVVLRLSGIYGPGRGYWLQQFLRGEARMEGTGARFLNMVHREDVAGAIIASLERAPGGAVYNVSDNEPATQRTVLTWLAARLQRPLPAEDHHTIERRRNATNKRISNRKLREELGYNMCYPSFREGFEAELAR